MDMFGLIKQYVWGRLFGHVSFSILVLHHIQDCYMTLAPTLKTNEPNDKCYLNMWSIVLLFFGIYLNIKYVHQTLFLQPK